MTGFSPVHKRLIKRVGTAENDEFAEILIKP